MGVPILTDVLNIGKGAVQQVLDSATAGPTYIPTAGTPSQAGAPIRDVGEQWLDALKKVKDDFITAVRGAARDTASAVAGGAADAIQNTPEIQRQKRIITGALVGVGALALLGVVLAVRSSRGVATVGV